MQVKNISLIKNPKKILFFRLDICLGDSIIHTFVLRELKKLFPQASLTVATFAPSDQFFTHNPHIDKLISLPPLESPDNIYRYFRPGIVWALLKMLAHSWIEKYDLVILPHTVHTPFNQLYSILLPHSLLPPYDYTQPIQQTFIRMLKQLGAQEVDTSYEFPIPTQDSEYAQQFLQKHNLQPNKFWVINPTGSMEYKNLSSLQIQTSLDTLRSTNIPAVVLDYKNQFPTLQNILRFTSTSIFQTAAFIGQSSGVISVDTGIVHLADCFHKKLLIFYAGDRPGPYNYSFWAPAQNSSRFLQGNESVKDIPLSVLQTEVSKFIKDLSN